MTEESKQQDPREIASAQTIAQLLAAMESSKHVLQRVKFAGRPVDIGPFVVESITLLLRSQAFILDEIRALQGKERTIQITARHDGGNGRRLIDVSEMERSD